MRIALLSNVTVEVLAGMLKKEHEIWTPPGFGGWMETALASPGELKAFNPEAMILVLDHSHVKVGVHDIGNAKASLQLNFPNSAVIVPNLDNLAGEVEGFYDDRLWKIAKMPWSMAGLRAIRNEILQQLSSVSCGYRKKAIAIDFDNTLWSGVVSEDGLAAIVHRREFQERIKQLVQRGIVLVGISKNNAEDVENVWEDGRMVLKRDDFSALRINWKDKAFNLREIAKELNLGTDAFVFIDDNPAERMRMKAVLPEVEVPDFPQDEEDIGKFIKQISSMHFPERQLTDEDLRRTKLYKEESERKEFAIGLSLEEYLKGLQLWVDIHTATQEEFARIAQLSQKSNQFNVLTNRYTLEEVSSIGLDKNHILLSARSGDRFGDQGLIAFVNVRLQDESAFIDDWVMSCRAMNRRLEFAIEQRVEEIVVASGVKKLYSIWRRTPKNSPVENVYESLGFDVVESAHNQKKYLLRLPRMDTLKHNVKFI